MKAVRTLILVLFAAVPPAAAQTAVGVAVSGVVQDQTGAVLPPRLSIS